MTGEGLVRPAAGRVGSRGESRRKECRGSRFRRDISNRARARRPTLTSWWQSVGVCGRDGGAASWGEEGGCPGDPASADRSWFPAIGRYRTVWPAGAQLVQATLCPLRTGTWPKSPDTTSITDVTSSLLLDHRCQATRSNSAPCCMPSTSTAPDT